MFKKETWHFSKVKNLRIEAFFFSRFKTFGLTCQAFPQFYIFKGGAACILAPCKGNLHVTNGGYILNLFFSMSANSWFFSPHRGATSRSGGDWLTKRSSTMSGRSLPMYFTTRSKYSSTE